MSPHPLALSQSRVRLDYNGTCATCTQRGVRVAEGARGLLSGLHIQPEKGFSAHSAAQCISTFVTSAFRNDPAVCAMTCAKPGCKVSGRSCSLSRLWVSALHLLRLGQEKVLVTAGTAFNFIEAADVVVMWVPNKRGSVVLHMEPHINIGGFPDSWYEPVGAISQYSTSRLVVFPPGWACTLLPAQPRCSCVLQMTASHWCSGRCTRSATHMCGFSSLNGICAPSHLFPLKMAHGSVAFQSACACIPSQNLWMP